jgi:outer membrane protein assembly factor BamE (lipoprotein component of BamABCDE complex)
MRTLTIGLLASVGLMAVTACTPVNSYEGFQVVDNSPLEIKAGVDTRSTVQAKLGSPTQVATFDHNEWFYITQVSSQTGFYLPRVDKRDVTAITFAKDGDRVVQVRNYTLKDGRVIAYNDHETPTRGREMTVLEQLLGSVSSIGALPPNQVNSNTHGGPGGP